MTSEEYDKLTDVEKRIKVAEFDGWTDLNSESMGDLSALSKVTDSAERVLVPDYLNDLNACHEMEKGMTEEQLKTFHSNLSIEGHCDYRFYDSDICHATARQRCKAFVLTMTAGDKQ